MPVVKAWQERFDRNFPRVLSSNGFFGYFKDKGTDPDIIKTFIAEEIEKAKQEAREEFAEQLKDDQEFAQRITRDGFDHLVVRLGKIDTLLAEYKSYDFEKLGNLAKELRSIEQENDKKYGEIR